MQFANAGVELHCSSQLGGPGGRLHAALARQFATHCCSISDGADTVATGSFHGSGPGTGAGAGVLTVTLVVAAAVESPRVATTMITIPAITATPSSANGHIDRGA